MQTFVDANGVPLAGGLVYIYVPNTTTPAVTWQDAQQLVPNANPIGLNASGQCSIWALDGQYRQIVQDQFGDVIWDQITQVGDGQTAAASSPAIVSSVVPESSPVPLPTATPTDITSIELPPGTWAVSGNVGNAASIGPQRVRGWISTTSATIPFGNPLGFVDTGQDPNNGVVTGPAPFLFATGMIVLELTQMTQVFLSTWAICTSGNDSCFGAIVAVQIQSGSAVLNGNLLPKVNPGAGSGQLWNNNGFVVVA
jgi:hypothetical protein